MTTRRTFGCIYFLSWMTGSVRAQTGEEMARYANARFAYSVEYPKWVLKPQGESDNGDGQRFVSPDGQTVLAIWGQSNALKERIGERFSHDMASLQEDSSLQVIYKVVRQDWFVMSGTAGAQIIYQKTLLRDGVYITLRLQYPAAKKESFDGAVQRIVASFRSLN